MSQFGALTASELYCPRCQRAQPVREKLLLVLPSGELHDFACTVCGSSLARRTTSAPAIQPVSTSRPVPRGLLR
jgi:transposase-like protein